MTEKQLLARIAMEKRLVAKLLEVAKAHGYECVAVDDGEERIPVDSDADAMEAVFAVDESCVYFIHPQEKARHVAFIVLGNDGWDAIADCSTGGKWDAVMAEMNDFSDKLCEEAV